MPRIPNSRRKRLLLLLLTITVPLAGQGNAMNRLQHETSPYLLQHADNPVDWYPWGEEAFAAAREQDKPVFLSIGYATCHWCHVMEHESFEDDQVARLLNEVFIPVKVDREERPDLDQVYMTVSQLLTGSGGWPLNVMLTPDKRPFYAATYIPKTGRYGRPGLLELIPRVQTLWAEKRAELLDSAEQIVEALKRVSGGAGTGAALEPEILDAAYRELADSFDAEHGGFGSAPMFPSPHNLLFLLRYWRRSNEPLALEMVEKTLRALRAGGIFDQVGFGFHRYSTDKSWLVPHFEKMLYDQALLALAYTEAFQATGDAFYRRSAEEIFTYVLRDMTDPKGGFYSAEDADSEGEEGKFYTWSYQELAALTSPEELSLLQETLGVRPAGNFLDEATRQPSNLNILHLQGGEAAEPEGFAHLRERLFAAREKRVHPLKDDKILTSWNGLMIAALARAGAVFDRSDYTRAADKAARFLLSTLRAEDGRLLHRYRAGKAGIAGFAEDYAYLIWGLIELYQAGFDTGMLETALKLNDIFIEDFWDETGGGFFMTADDAAMVLVRPKDPVDGALPSPGSVAQLNLLRLGRMTANAGYEQRAESLFRSAAAQVRRHPTAYTHLLSGLAFALGPGFEVVIAGVPGREDTRALLRRLRGLYLPNTVLLFRPAGEANPPVTALAPSVRAQDAAGGQATAYVCRNTACELPVTDGDKMVELLTAGR
jgi:uncharacterized protein YyaL (SSP411 family)